jgi:hypothetical protein
MAKGEKKIITLRIPKLNPWTVSTLLLTIILIVVISGRISFIPTGKLIANQLTPDEAANKAINYINDYILQGQEKATLVTVEETENGVYYIKIKIDGRTFDSYVTKDGELLFPSAINLEETPKIETQQKAKSCEDLKKSKTPTLEAFVVSYCPFGLQMQRVLSNIVENIPELANYIKVRYIGSIENGNIRSMHGEKEATENLRQICIREEQSEKYWDYISCFIKKGESENCLTSSGIDKSKLEECMNDANRGIRYAKEDFDLQDKYGVTGSPTLILNGERVSEFDFGGRTAEAVKTLLCCGFEEKPDFCSKTLSTQQAARGFSETYSGSSGTSSGQC